MSRSFFPKIVRDYKIIICIGSGPHFAKSCISPCLLKFDNINKFHCAIFEV